MSLAHGGLPGEPRHGKVAWLTQLTNDQVFTVQQQVENLRP